MVEIGLNNVAGNPNLTFIFFIGFTMLAVLGLRFAYYAYRNRAETEMRSQAPIWTHLVYIGVLSAIFSLAGIVEIVSSLQLPYKSAAMLGATLMLAFTIRQIHYTATSADGGAEKTHPFERLARSVFVASVLLLAVVLFQFGQSNLAAAIEGLAGLSFLGYGVAFYHDQVSNARLQGTMLDSLLRHLLPVLAFAALISIASLAELSVPRIVVLHVEVVFIIMTATALMTGTIKLRQNLASL